MRLPQLNGVFPPVPTIVDASGHLDRKGMAALLDRLIAAGVDGVLILGSGGEFSHIPKAMRFEVAAFAVAHIAGRVPILLGISSPSTDEAIEFGLDADRLGVDAVLAVNPYYALLDDAYIYNHFRRLAEAVKSPVLLYNFPALTKQDLKAGLIRRLVDDVPNIVGLKDTVNDLSHLIEVINVVRPDHPDFVLFSGYDEYLMDGLILGANGGIPATCNFAPELTCGLYAAFKAGDWERMFALQRRIAAIRGVYAIDSPFFGTIKAAIRLTGLDISAEVMAPARKLPDDKVAELKRLLVRAGLVAS
jgi:2-dehydro-3-deoxy-D-pentonate aldolase